VVFHGKVSILVLIEEEVFLTGIIRPDIINAFINIPFIIQFLEIFNHLNGGSAPDAIVD
jgi:hypothetical protein